MDSPTTAALGRQMDAPARARKFVADVLRRGDLDELTDNAQLVTSELVANALLHTESPVTLSITIKADTVRVEVHDECLTLPVPGVLGREAISGRGLLMVERMSQRWGVTRVPGIGKSVWFELVAGIPTAAEQLLADELLDLWADGDLPSPEALPSLDVVTLESDAAATIQPDDQGPTRIVRVEGVRTELLLHAKEHIDDLVRELVLAADSSTECVDQDSADLKRLGEHLCTLAPRLLPFRNEIRRQAVEAAQRHEPQLILELELPLGLRDDLRDYRRSLDEADEHCCAGRLLLTDCAGEHVEFRRWKLDRILEQLG